MGRNTKAFSPAPHCEPTPGIVTQGNPGIINLLTNKPC